MSYRTCMIQRKVISFIKKQSSIGSTLFIDDSFESIDYVRP